MFYLWREAKAPGGFPSLGEKARNWRRRDDMGSSRGMTELLIVCNCLIVFEGGGWMVEGGRLDSASSFRVIMSTEQRLTAVCE